MPWRSAPDRAPSRDCGLLAVSRRASPSRAAFRCWAFRRSRRSRKKPGPSASSPAWMREVYYAALEKQGGRWQEIIAAQCLPPQSVKLPPGEWVGAGNGFAVYGDLGLKRFFPEIHPTAIAVARLAAPRLTAGEGVDPADAAPVYVREKVAFTQAELAQR